MINPVSPVYKSSFKWEPKRKEGNAMQSSYKIEPIQQKSFGDVLKEAEDRVFGNTEEKEEKEEKEEEQYDSSHNGQSLSDSEMQYYLNSTSYRPNIIQLDEDDLEL